MTGTTQLQEFNQFFSANYNYLLGFAKSINVRNDYESLLHNSYLKCAKRIDLSGYSGSTYLNYARVTIINTFKTNYRDKRHTIDCDNPDYQEEIENILIEEHEYQEQKKLREQEMSYINTQAFEYCDKYFTPRDNMIFKTYYVLKHKHLNYKQLAEATGYSITSVSNTIKRMKKSLRENLITFINTGYNNMEVQDLIKKVEAILPTSVERNAQNYKETYFQVFGRHWSGCPCNKGVMREALRSWLIKTKSNLK